MKRSFVLVFVLAMSAVLFLGNNILFAAPATKRAPVNLTARALTPEASSRKLMELVISKDYQQCMNFKKRGETCVKMTEPEYFALLSRSFVFFSDMRSWAKKNGGYKDDNAYRNGILAMMDTLRDAAAGKDPIAAHKMVGTIYSDKYDLRANALLFGDFVNANTLGLGRVDIRDVTKLTNLKYIIAKYQRLNKNQLAALIKYIPYTPPAGGSGNGGNASADKTSDGPTPTNDMGSAPGADVAGCLEQAMSQVGSFTTPPGAAKLFMPTDPNTGGSFGLTGAPKSGPGSGNITTSGKDPCLGTDFSKMPGYGKGKPGDTLTVVKVGSDGAYNVSGNGLATSLTFPADANGNVKTGVHTETVNRVTVTDKNGNTWSQVTTNLATGASTCTGTCVNGTTPFPPPTAGTADGSETSSYTKPDGTVVTITKDPDGVLTIKTVMPDGTQIVDKTGATGHNSTVEITKPDGSIETVITNPDGSTADVVKNPDKTTTTVSVDQNGNIVKTIVQNPDGSIKSSTTPNPDGSSTTITPDGTKVVTIKSLNGDVTTFAQNPNGTKSITIINPDGTTTTSTLNPDGSVTTTTKHPDGTTETSSTPAAPTSTVSADDQGDETEVAADDQGDGEGGGDESETGMANQYSDNSPAKSKCGSTVTYCSLNGGGSDSSGGNSGSDSNCSAAKSGFNKDAPPEGPFGCGGGDPTVMARQSLMVIDKSPVQIHELIHAYIKAGASTSSTTTVREMVNKILK